MDNVTFYMETVYNSSYSMNSTRNLNKNRKKSSVCKTFTFITIIKITAIGHMFHTTEFKGVKDT